MAIIGRQMLFSPRKSSLVVVGWGSFSLVLFVSSSFIFFMALEPADTPVFFAVKSAIGLAIYLLSQAAIEELVLKLSLRFSERGIHFVSGWGRWRFVPWRDVRNVLVEPVSITIFHPAGKIVFARAFFERYVMWVDHIVTSWKRSQVLSEQPSRQGPS